MFGNAALVTILIAAAITPQAPFPELTPAIAEGPTCDAKPNELLSSAVKLSKKLAKDFKLVRIDWFINDDKLYFNEMTFTPYSGYFYFPEKYEKWDYILGKMLNLKGN